MQFRVMLQVEQVLIKDTVILKYGPAPVILIDTNDGDLAIAEFEKIREILGKEIGYQRIARGE